MNPRLVRHVPWTCEWGRYGVAVQQVGPGESRVDGVFWVCHHPDQSPEVRSVTRQECESCPEWIPATRLQ